MTKEQERARFFAALSHPLRHQILEMTAGNGSTSPKEMAEQLDVKIENLSYHVRSLHQDGFIRLVKTKPVRGTIERFYTSTERGRRALALARKWSAA